MPGKSNSLFSVNYSYLNVNDAEYADGGQTTQQASTKEAVLDPGSISGLGERGETIVMNDLKPQRNIGTFRLIAAGFNISNSWFAIAASLSVAIATGGTVSIIYGIVIIFLLYSCAALTMAELASVYPTAGGQYHFSSVLAPKKWNRPISYACGMIATSSWVALNASVNILAAQMVTSLAQFFLDYTPKDWHLFFIYQAVNVFTLCYNIFLLSRTAWVHEFGCKYHPHPSFLIATVQILITSAPVFLTLTTFVVSVIASLARSEKQTSTYVWTNFESNNGWPPAVSFLTGLITPCYMYAGLDAALHLAEETRTPRRDVPLALLWTIGIGFLTAFTFSVGMSYTITDLEALLNDP